jgi:hypothetical protein
LLCSRAMILRRGGAPPRVMRIAHRLRRAALDYRRRDTRATGVEFVNRILAPLGLQPLSESQYQAYLEQARSDPHLRPAFERHLPYVRSMSSHNADADWDARWRPAGTRILGSLNVFYVLPRVLRPQTVVHTGVA